MADGLPRIWGGAIPPPSPRFTGRDEDLAALTHGLAAGSRVTVHSLRGMGGIGKTQLAAEYAHARAQDYPLVWWIAAEEPATIPDQFTALATQLGLDPASEPDALQAQIHDRLRTVAGWLLIFDNADTVADIEPWLPPGPVPAGAPGHVIVTTRRGGFAALGRVLDLDVIDLASAVALLRSRVPDLRQDVGEDLAEELGKLPLALEQTAAYLAASGMPAAGYLELLRTRAAGLLRPGTVTGQQNTIATLWDISLDRLGAQAPAAVQLLDVCAYLAPEPIPVDLFTAHPGLLPEPLATAAAETSAFAGIIAALADYSLAKGTPAGLQLHRLVQAAIRARHQSGAGSLAVPLALLAADAPGEIASVPAAWPRWAVLLPHVLAAISHLSHTGPQPDPEVMEDASRLLNAAGVYLRVHGRSADARPLLERGLAIDEASYGPDHPGLAPALNSLALVLEDLAQPEQARPLLERALAVTEGAYGPDHPDVAKSLNNLAALLQDLGQPGEARPLAERALAITEATHGPGHPEVAARQNNLAVILGALGQVEQARLLQERALATDEATYGPDHPDVATDLNNLAALLLDLRQPEAARPLLERALAIDEASYGPDHPDVARDLDNLSMALLSLRQPGQARPLAARALAIDEASYGPDHPHVAIRLDNLARILLNLGQPGQAMPLMERALAIDEATYGPGNPHVAMDLRGLGVVLRVLGRSGEARLFLERALAIHEASYGPGHPDVAVDRAILALVLQDQGLPGEPRRRRWSRRR